jgi:hypothetical protein
MTLNFFIIMPNSRARPISSLVASVDPCIRCSRRDIPCRVAPGLRVCEHCRNRRRPCVSSRAMNTAGSAAFRLRSRVTTIRAELLSLLQLLDSVDIGGDPSADPDLDIRHFDPPSGVQASVGS